MIRTAAAVLFVAFLVTACTDRSEQVDGPSGASNPVGEDASLVHAFDGDSMEVVIDGDTREVRLIGINAPEGDECYGDAAREALVDVIDGRGFVLVETADDIDEYGRLLRYVYVDGENINARMLSDGNAVNLQTDHPLADDFFEIGAGAAEARIGMWAIDACGPPPPRGVTITDVAYDPPGRDGEHLNDEFVTITNGGTDPVNLSGWILRDESSQNRYRFGGVEVMAGKSVSVRTGCGTDTTSTVFWCSDLPIWSNGGDTAILQDRHGTVADRWAYRGNQ